MSACYKAILLDFDGTIIESVGVKDWAFQELYKEHLTHIDDIMAYHLEHNATLRFEKFEYIATNILNQDYSESMKSDLSERFHALVFDQIVQSPFVKGAEEFLNYFSENKVSLFLISKSPDDELLEILDARNLKKYFKNIYGGSWSKIDAIQNVLDQEILKNSEVCYIGDAREDQLVAHQKNISFIGRDSGKAFDLKNDLIFDDLLEIKNYLLVLENMKI